MFCTKAGILFFLILLSNGYASANNLSILQQCSEHRRLGKVLKMINCLKQKKLEDSVFAQHDLAIAYSFVGMSMEADKIINFNDASGTKKNDVMINIVGLKKLNAIKVITEAVADKPVVMLNEAHHKPMHRYFALQLAKSLREKGFTHIAMETLSADNVAQTMENGHATYQEPTTGYYTADPVFAYFVRESIKMGYLIYSYEAHGVKGMAEREEGQASNLQQLFVDAPDAKVFVYAGYGHIRRGHFGNGIATMANHFHQKTGIVPFLIDQVSGSHSYYQVLDDPVLTFVSKHFDIAEPSVFKRQNGRWLVSQSFQNAVDMTVFHPKESSDRDRPHWITKDRTLVKMQASAFGREPPILVRAVVADDKEFSVPIDQILILDHDHYYLALPKGNFRIEFESDEKFKIFNFIEIGDKSDSSTGK